MIDFYSTLVSSIQPWGDFWDVGRVWWHSQINVQQIVFEREKKILVFEKILLT